MDKTTIEAVITAMEDRYRENGRNRPMEYAYGFFDALAVLRELRDGERALPAREYRPTL